MLCLCTATAVVIGALLGGAAIIFGNGLLSLYSKEANVIEYGMIRLTIICGTYFLCGIMETVVGSIRGMGSSVVPMIVSLFWACAFRVIWVLTVFEKHKNLETLYISYPISWLCTITFQLIYFVWLYKKKKRIEKI